MRNVELKASLLEASMRIANLPRWVRLWLFLGLNLSLLIILASLISLLSLNLDLMEVSSSGIRSLSLLGHENEAASLATRMSAHLEIGQIYERLLLAATFIYAIGCLSMSLLLLPSKKLKENFQPK